MIRVEETDKGTADQTNLEKLKFNLLSIFLLVGAAGSWVAYWTTASALRSTTNKLNVLQAIAGELVISDDSRVAAVRKNYSALGGTAWEVFIPEGLQLALHYISPSQQRMKVGEFDPSFFPMSPGRHVVVYRDNYLFVDDRVITSQAFSFSARNGFNDLAAQEIQSGASGQPFAIINKRLWIGPASSGID